MPIDVPFIEVNRLMEAQFVGKTFPRRRTALRFAATVRRASVAASGDRLLISLRVRPNEQQSWFGLGTDANVYLWGRPVLDPKTQVLRLTDVALDVESEGVLGAAARAAAPYFKAAVAEQTAIDLKPFAANARKSIQAAIAEFRATGDGVRVDASVADLRVVDIAFDATTLRIIAEADGAAKVLVTSLPKATVFQPRFAAPRSISGCDDARPDSRLCMCTMNAVPNSGVARLRIGIDTNAARNSPARKTVLWLALRSFLASAGERKRMAASSKYSRLSRKAVARKKITAPKPANNSDGSATR